MYAIETENLYKSYDGVHVLKGLSLRVPQGQVYGLLGPNGAGKSTLIHLLLGFLKPNSGSIRLFEQADLERARGRIGYLPERLRYHLRYSAREYLRYLGQFSDLREPELTRRVDQELATVRLTDVADRALSTYSKGMLQRLGIAQALLSDPDILLIDEPTSGLDPTGQREMLALLADMRSPERTILLTTHYLDEIDALCDTVGVLFGGTLAAELDVQSLRRPGRSALIKVDQLAADMIVQLHALPGVRCKGREIAIQPNSAALQTQVLKTLLQASINIISLEPQGHPLEDIYSRVVRGESFVLPTDEPLPGRFAPPGHPDALGPPAVAPAPAPGSARNGETLLRELLGGGSKPDGDPSESDD